MSVVHSPLLPSDLSTLVRDLNLRLAEMNEAVSLLYKGVGTPEGLVSAPVGSLYQRTDGTTDTAVYRKEIGSNKSGWVALGGGVSATELSIVDDFLHGRGDNTDQHIGDWGWYRAADPSPTTSNPFLSSVNPDVDRPGVVIMTGGTPPAIGGLKLTNVTTMRLDSNYDARWDVKPSPSDLSNRIGVGFCQHTSLLLSDPANFTRIITKDIGGGDVRWVGQHNTNNTLTETAPFAANAASGYHALRIRRIDANNVGFTVGTESELSLAATSTSIVVPRVELQNLVGQPSIMIDYFSLAISGLNR